MRKEGSENGMRLIHGVNWKGGGGIGEGSRGSRTLETGRRGDRSACVFVLVFRSVCEAMCRSKVVVCVKGSMVGCVHISCLCLQLYTFCYLYRCAVRQKVRGLGEGGCGVRFRIGERDNMSLCPHVYLFVAVCVDLYVS